MKEHCRITLPPKEVLLKDECKQMYSELKRKAPDINFSKFNLKNFEKEHIGEKKGIKEGDFFFNSKKEVEDTISELFMNEYNLHLMSHKSVLLDEDEEFEEEIPMDKDLGMVETKTGLKSSSVASITCKVLPWWKRDPKSGLPFKVTSFRLILDQDELEPEEEKAKEPKFEGKTLRQEYQTVLSDFWKV